MKLVQRKPLHRKLLVVLDLQKYGLFKPLSFIQDILWYGVYLMICKKQIDYTYVYIFTVD
jgi:hypothetical protein